MTLKKEKIVLVMSVGEGKDRKIKEKRVEREPS